MAASKALINKINALPADRIGQVEDFVDFLLQRDLDPALPRSAATIGARTLAAVWKDPEEDSDDAFDFG